MSIKCKALLISIIACLCLAMSGLAVGLVLVATSATAKSQITVGYVAENVSCVITASGSHKISDDDSETIYLSDENNTNATELIYNITPKQNTITGTITFNHVELTSTSKAIYSFNISNTADSNNPRELKVKNTITGLSATDNITVNMGNDIDSAVETNMHYENIGIGGNNTTIYTVINVTDSTTSIDSLSLNIQLEIGYDIPDPNVFSWGDATGESIIGIINESNIDSTISLPDDTSYSSSTNASKFFVKGFTSNYYSTDNNLLELEFYVSGSPAIYTIEVEMPSGRKFSNSAYFNGTNFETEIYDHATIIILDDGLNELYIDFGLVANYFDRDLWEENSRILITITPA